MNKPSVDLKAILYYSDNIFSSIGLCFNFLLLFLILTKTSPQLRDYRRVLLQNCLVDLFYNTIQLIMKLSVEFKNGNILLLFTNDYGRLPPILACYLICFWVFALFMSLTTLPVQFIYRYFLIIRNTKLNNVQYSLILLPSFFFAGTYAGYAIYVIWPREPLYSQNAQLLAIDPYFYRELPNFASAYIEDWSLIALAIYCYFIGCITYGIILWSNYAVWKYLKQMEHHVSLQMKDANQQIAKTLILQATLPIFVCLIPIIITVTVTLFRADIQGLGLIVSLCFSWIPIVDTFVTIYSVKSYRSAIFDFFSYFLKFSQQQDVIVPFSSTTPSHINSTRQS